MSSKPSHFSLSNLLALVVLFIASLSVGAADFSWRHILSLSDGIRLMLVSRLPRTSILVLTGASMAAMGMIMQILAYSRLVEPSTIGVSQSAALGLLLMPLFFPTAAPMGKMAVATVAALAGMLLFMALIRRLSPTAQLVVPPVGTVFGGVIESAAVFIGYEADMLQILSIWQQGGLFGVLPGRYELLWSIGILALAAYPITDRLIIADLNETVSVNLGLNRDTVLWSGLVIVALITSLVVVTIGNIPFIGLVVFSIISHIMGDRLRCSLPAVTLLGASSVLLYDIIGRVIVFPFGIPVFIVFGIVGMILFLRLLLKKPAYAI